MHFLFFFAKHKYPYITITTKIIKIKLFDLTKA
jgi:hypothetical protein